MSNFLQPATIADVFGGETDGFAQMQQMTRLMRPRSGNVFRDTLDYNTILNDMQCNKSAKDVSENGIEIKSEEIDNLKEQSINVIKKINLTRQKQKCIDDDLKKANEELNKFNETKKAFTLSYKELLDICIKNEININDDSNFVDKLIGSLYVVENKLHENHIKLQDDKNKITGQLAILTSFINTALKDEIGEESLSIVQTGNKCGICIENDVNCAFAPCGHTTCAGCAVNINRCHVCRAHISSKIKIYFS